MRLSLPSHGAAESGLIRAERDRRLAASDLYALADRWAALTDIQRRAITVYRQELRDLPAQYRRLADVVWPQDPIRGANL